ncbi:MAG: MFS transporter [Chitinophagaceae bacterium]|nr:MFS transporter [Chitinophagaceae bacterium]MCW5928761.1 MFS transporter [Chitinophagaceae bacterium]
MDESNYRVSAPLAAVKIPEFRNLLAGRFFFIFSLRMMSTLVGWWIYKLTSAPFAIGLIGLSEVIPALSLALYAGYIIDISEKRRLILRGITFYLAAAVVLLLLSTRYSHAHLTNIGVAIGIYAVIFCTGIIRAFTGPSFNVILALVVPRAVLPNATTWNQGTWLTASVTGHAIGGLCIGFIGNTGTLLVICCSFVISLIALFSLNRHQPEKKQTEKRSWESVKEGLRFVYRTKDLLGAISLDMFAVFFGGAVAMVPVFASDILKVGPQGFGILNAAADIGAICSVLLLTFFPMRKQQGKRMIVAVAGFGLCIIIFAISEWFWLSFFALMLAGVLDGISMVIRGTIMQLKTPNEMKGRVMSVNFMFVNSSNELGQFESGLMAKLMGVIPSVIFGGCMTFLVAATTWFKAKELRKLEY